MLSIDANLLLYAFNSDSPWFAESRSWLTAIQADEDVATSELILAEFYGLLRNRAVLAHPLSAEEAVELVQTFRRHLCWRLIGFPDEGRALHDTLRQKARAKDFTFRKLYDTRSALTMIAQGVTEFASVNLEDFQGLGFRKVWNPLSNA